MANSRHGLDLMGARRRSFLIFMLTIAAAVSLALGLTQPIMKLTRLYFWGDDHSLIGIIEALYETGETFLAAVILIFSVIFPMLKLLYIAAASTLISPESLQNSRWLQRLDGLGKWSMLDVLVLALLVFYAKSTTWADATALPGIYFFAASVIFTMAAYSLIHKQAPKD